MAEALNPDLLFSASDVTVLWVSEPWPEHLSPAEAEKLFPPHMEASCASKESKSPLHPEPADTTCAHPGTGLDHQESR